MTFRLPGGTASVALLLCVTAFLPDAALSTQDTARIVAIGDIHGGSDELAGILQQAGLIDDQHRWSGGSTILVQTGAIMMDRGANIRAVMDLLMTLEEQADAAGGKVEVLLGNYETLNLMGTVRDVGASVYTSFADEDSAERREQAYQAYIKLNAGLVKMLGREPPNL